MPKLNRFAFALLASTGFCTAQAVEYIRIDPDASQINFVYQQMGVSMNGHFKRFDSQLRFDPDAPEQASLQLEIELASVDTGTADGNNELATKDWFDSAHFPQANFRSKAVKLIAPGQLEVSGTLEIKGQQREIIIPANFKTSDNSPHARFSGQFNLKRGDFAIGEGAWKAFDIVANEVSVKFELQASTE